MTKTYIYQDMGKGVYYLKINGRFEEIPDKEMHRYRGCPVSHGYMSQVTMEQVLWLDGLNDKPTIEDELLEARR